MATQPTVADDTMECPLCLGKGQLRRAEVLDRLGVKDLARIAQLSAEEALRMLLSKNKQDENALWLRFEAELTKRVSDVTERHKTELQKLKDEKGSLELRLSSLTEGQEELINTAKQSERLDVERQLQDKITDLGARIGELEAENNLADQGKAVEIQAVRNELEAKLHAAESSKDDLTRRAEDYLKEAKSLRQEKDALQTELAKVARVGKREELDFAAEVRTWPGIWISDKLPKGGDYILAYRDPAGNAMDPHLLVDNKDKDSLGTSDIDKLVRDATDRSIRVAALVARDENQLRQLDREARWSSKDGVWVLRTTRQWLPRDLDILRPLFERMREEGPDFLEDNVHLADEVRRTFADIDGIEKELKKASNALKSASGLVTKYRSRLQALCDASCTHKIPLKPLITDVLEPINSPSAGD
ncbi:MAG: hypothetical protein WCA49_03290 [Candidatus Sulfotelmatobacter sp.]